MEVLQKIMKYIDNLHNEKRVRKTELSILEAAMIFLTKTEEGCDLISSILASSPTGTRAMISALGCEQKPGDSLKDYIVDAWGVKLKASDVVEFRGYTGKGYPIPYNSVSTEDTDQNTCSECGIIGPCIKEVTMHDATTSMMCNKCRMHLWDMYSSDSIGSQKVCDTCTKISCYHNPQNEKNKVICLPQNI